MSLYKYLTPERMEIFTTKQIRFTQPSALNDPNEMKPYFEAVARESYFREEIESKIQENLLEDVYAKMDDDHKTIISFELFSAMLEMSPGGTKGAVDSAISQALDFLKDKASLTRKRFFESLDKMIGTLCLTEKFDNLAMWAHYAQGHQGFVIEFDEKHNYFNQKRTPQDECGFLRQVIYKTEKPDFPELDKMTAEDVFLVKLAEWEYEKEWRMLRPLKDADKVIENEQANIHLFSINPECITGVIFGYKMSKEKKDEIIKIIDNDEEFFQVKKYQAELNEKSFLERVEM